MPNNRLDGIDISKWQGDINLSKVPCEFVIVKATQSNNYINPYYTKKVDEAISLNKLVGVYHYCGGGVGAKKEAEYFVNNIKKYLGKVLIAIDWEGDMNPKFGDSSYLLNVMDEVYNLTGIKPLLYMSKSVCRTSGMDKIASKYELWCAQYKNMENVYGYLDNPWTDNKGFGPWSIPVIYQYSSRGRFDGYNGNLDIDKAYMTKEEWNNRCKKSTVTPKPEPKESTSSFVGKVCTVTASNTLNIRQSSDKSSKIIGFLKNSSRVKVDKVENGMAHFSGWCSKSYLK